jgi:4-hydroxy-3-methylbut-2-enyl diphosphate reductase
MPATEQTWWNLKQLHVVFGITAIVLLLTTIAMLAADHNRPWKKYQKGFRNLETWSAAARVAEESSDSYATKTADLEAALADARRAAIDPSLTTAFLQQARTIDEDAVAADLVQTDVDRFVAQGVVFVDSIEEVPIGSPIMLSAHGSAPEIVAAARSRGSYVVDAVCPLVTKVHHEVKTRAAKGYHIVYIGHEGHEEAVGTMAVAPASISRVESLEEVKALPQFDSNVAMLAQTTLSHREWNEIAVHVRERFPDVWTPGKSDLCFATTNRQTALISIASTVDAFVIIGSSNSSNTRALERLAIEAGCSQVFRINSFEELPKDLYGTVGVTAGASAPEELVQGVLEFLAPSEGVEEIFVTEEDEYFPPPRNIRDLQMAVDTAITVMAGAPLLTTASMDDRALAASVVLETLLLP